MSSWEWNVPCFGQRRPATSSNELVVAPANFEAGSLDYWLFWARKSLKGATVTSQPGRNIPGKFAECSLNVAMFRTSREHLENILTENIFQQIVDGKVAFVLKIYDLMKTNVDFWQIPIITEQCFQNIQKIFHEFLFQNYSKIIPGILQSYKNVFMNSKSKKIAFALCVILWNF